MVLICFLTAVQSQNSSLNELIQNWPEGKKPRIGLALSGGAAHGLAHIGVIKYLEELGIQIDYVTGTSMGAIVGGFVAMGYDSPLMTEIAANQNWNLVLSNSIPLEEVSPIEKLDHDKFLLNLEYNEGSFTLPKGFIAGQKLDLLISKLYSPAFEITDFDDLPIPFRCFAVDIGTGDVVTLKSGYLGRAIRASMSIPTVFKPSYINGRLLVDGGLIRNFPVSDNYDMGADIVIGVYVGSNLEKTENMKSLLDVFKQSVLMMGIQDSERQKKMASVVIEPEIEDIDAFGFKDYSELIKRGYDATKKEDATLKKLADFMSHFEKNEKPEKLKYRENVDLASIQIHEENELLKKVIADKLTIETDNPVTLQQIDKDITSVFGTKNFENIGFSLQNEDGENKLSIFPSKRRETNLGINLNYYNSTKSAFVIRSLFRNILATPSRLTIMGRASENYGLKADYFYRLGNQRNILIGADGVINKFDRGYYEGSSLRSLYKNTNSRAAINLSIESSTRSIATFSVGFERDFIRPKVRIDLDFGKYIKTELYGQLKYKFNSLKDPYFSKNGLGIELVANYKVARNLELEYNSDEAAEFLNLNEARNLFNLKASLNHNSKWTSKISSHLYLSAFYSSEATLTDNFMIGGTNINTNRSAGFSGLTEFEYNLSKAAIIRNEFRYEILPKTYFGISLNYLIGQNDFPELLGYYLTSNDVSEFGWGFVISYDSPIGPFIFDAGVVDGGTQTAFSFGHRFIF